ncbi:5-carboxymethyl-2-hydroxymuconate Delta-isomerase [Thiohalospira sp.]|uniref:5-carboxymethyl-2-hydroxymuconate Delta-isomerase n=1 Tax=Thiohalospira sp. TaxID=3080549 RepID=UPI003980B615
MPHLQLEYAEELVAEEELPGLLAVVHAAARDTGLFVESHIRIRARPVAHYLVGGERAPFAHVELRIRAGRHSRHHRLLADAVVAALQPQLPTAALSAEVVEINEGGYARHYPDPEEERP